MVARMLYSPDQGAAVPLAAAVLWDFDRYLAEQLKRQGLSQAEAKALEAARDRLHRMVADQHQRGRAA